MVRKQLQEAWPLFLCFLFLWVEWKPSTERDCDLGEDGVGVEGCLVHPSNRLLSTGSWYRRLVQNKPFHSSDVLGDGNWLGGKPMHNPK